MAGRRVHVVMDAALVERIDQALRGESRGEFVRRAVERALEERGSRGESPDVVAAPAPAEQPGFVTGPLLRRPDSLGDAARKVRGDEVAPRRHSPTCSCGVCKP